MRQIFTSPRLENVEGVASLLEEAGIDTKVSEGRGYKQVSRREFSYVARKVGEGNDPAVWVIKSDDYKRARELLHGMGMLDKTQAPSYLPEELQFKQAPVVSPLARMRRIRMFLLIALGVMVLMTVIRMSGRF